MAWDVEMTELLRVLVNDMDTTQLYADEKLRRVLVVAAFQVEQEMTFSQTFAVNISEGTIYPDPTVATTKEESFVNLACLKAACIIDRGSAAASARKAVLVKDGGSTYDSRMQLQGKLKLLEKGWCAVYDDAKLEYMSGQVRTAGAVVMSPFRLYAYSGLYGDRSSRTHY